MASIGWKKFKFFDEGRHREVHTPEGTTGCAGEDDDVWLASADGLVVCMDRDFSIKATFSAFAGPVHFLNVSQGRLIALGEAEDGLKSLSLKVWGISGLRSGVTPTAIASAKVFVSSKLPEGTLTAAAACCDAWPTAVVAVGTSTGGVYIFRGDAAKGKLTAPFGRHVLRNAPAVTALHFAGAATSRHLFTLSSSSVVALDLSTGRTLLEDDCGAGPGCSAVTQDGELLVPSPDAVFFYTAEEGRKAAAAIRGPKHALVAFKRYVAAVVSEDSGKGGEGAVLRVFDVANKLVAASAPVELPVRWLIAGRRGVALADASGEVLHFEERSLEQRLESLFKSRSFQLALRVAQSENAGPKVVTEVRRSFGDFLYNKRDYEGAAAQYSATVGHLEPSYVIQRFLDAQRVHNLTSYLEAVHEAGLATPDHTSLLLNCYTKLRDVSKIDAFIQKSDAVRASGAPPRFDAAAAIAVLRYAGYPQHAARLALAAGLSDDYLSVLLEECQQCGEALEYIKSLPRRAAAAAMHRFGKPLLAAEPVGFTALLMELCLPASDFSVASSSKLSSSTKETAAADGTAFVANLADFTHLYTERPDDLRYACVAILAMGHPNLPSRQTLYHTLLDLYLSNTPSVASTTGCTSASGSVVEGRAAAGPSSFNGSPSSTTTRQNGDRAEALDLLRRGWPPGMEPAYDVDRALTTCRLHSFHEGLVFLHTNRREFREAVAVLAAARDWGALLEACEAHGSAAAGGDPEVWHDALELLSSPAAGPGASSTLRELLARIEGGGILPPLAVLPVLARNPHLRLEMVKDYVTRALQADSRAIAADVEEIDALKAEVEAAEAAVRRLTTEPVIFQSNRDSQTGAPLELPSVHFLCCHSFNLRTLGDGVEGQECPLCAPEHRRVRELQRSHKASAADKDAFFRRLKAAPDGFGLVAEYFGKGMLNNTSVVTRSAAAAAGGRQ